MVIITLNFSSIALEKYNWRKVILKHKKPYRPLVQQKYCCVPATIQWILYRRRFDILDQETIGVELGLQVPPKSAKWFSNPKIIVTTKPARAGYGTQIDNPKYDVNKFFKKYKIPLKFERHLISKISDVKKFLKKHFAKDNDVLAMFHTGCYKPKGKRAGGHLAVVVEVDLDKGLVTLGDPWYKTPMFWKIKLDTLIDGMSDRYDGIEREFDTIKPVKVK